MSPLEHTRLAGEARQRGWQLTPAVIKNVGEGCDLALRLRFPNASPADLVAAKKVLRENACTLLNGNDGNWSPKLPGEKGGWFAHEIERLLSERNELFIIALSKN